MLQCPLPQGVALPQVGARTGPPPVQAPPGSRLNPRRSSKKHFVSSSIINLVSPTLSAPGCSSSGMASGSKRPPSAASGTVYGPPEKSPAAPRRARLARPLGRCRPHLDGDFGGARRVKGGHSNVPGSSRNLWRTVGGGLLPDYGGHVGRS